MQPHVIVRTECYLLVCYDTFEASSRGMDIPALLAVRKAMVDALCNLLCSVFVSLILELVFHGEVSPIMFNHFVVWWNIISHPRRLHLAL
jgi:hypothetical protein